MRQGICRLLAMFMMAAVLVGCGSSSVIVNGRNITGRGGALGHARAQTDGTGASVIFGKNKIIHVSQRQVSWSDGSYDLPDKWQNLELKDASDGVKVIVDGKEMTSIKL